jgi:hypothetical protein
MPFRKKPLAYACALMFLCLVLVFGPAVSPFNKPQISVRPVLSEIQNQRESPVTKQASGTFEVSLTPQKPDHNPAERARLGRTSIDKRFHGISKPSATARC